jgi:hypothetical protein
MKKHIVFFLLVTATIFSMPLREVQAIPAGNGNHAGDYIFSDDDLSSWMVGAMYQERERHIDTLNQRKTFKTTRSYGYLAYQWRYGIMPYGLIGTSESRLEFNRDTELESGLGLHLNLFDHEVPDPTLMEDKLRINATAQYTKSRMNTSYGRSISWQELYGSLILSVVNDLEGNKFFNLDSIAFFAGITYSDIISSGIDEHKKGGFIYGINFFVTENICLEVGFENIDKSAIFFGMHAWL